MIPLGLALLLHGAPHGGLQTAAPRPGRVVPQVSALAAARKRGDAIELERIARLVGPAGLASAMTNEDKRVRSAAVAAAPRMEDAWTLLEPLSRVVADDPDEVLAREAADAASVIADGLSPLAGDEIPHDAIRRTAQTLAHAAASRPRDAELRIAALGAVASLGTRVPAESLAGLPALLVDADPRVRRAAVEAMGAGLTLRGAERIRTLLEKEPSAEVTAPAAAAVCRLAESVPEARALAPMMADRARRIARDGATPAEDVLELLGCLGLSGSLADRQVLGELARAHADGQVRSEAARQLARPAVPLVAPAPSATKPTSPPSKRGPETQLPRR